MKRFKNILVVFDRKTDNQALFNHAVDLAQRNQAALTLVDVLEESPTSLSNPPSQEPAATAQKHPIPIIEELFIKNPLSPISDLPVDDRNNQSTVVEKPLFNIQEFITQEEQRSFQEYVAAIKQSGIQVNSKILFGTPFRKIIQEVLQGQLDLVMITADGSGTSKETLFGSTTMHLMRKCPCPVWVIKPPGQPSHINRILAAVDLVKGDHERAALANKIIELATSLARSQQSELLILHTWSLFGESILRGRGGISNEAIEKLLQETQDDHRQWLVELLQQHSLEDLKSEVYLLKGDAGTLINDLAQVKEVDLIVMGTVSRVGLSGLLIGNTAEKVLQQANCSMLTVKPEGFVSPVKPDQG
jgi:universal stress protein E